MIRLRHKLLIQLFRGLDLLILIGTLAVIIFFRPEVVAKGGSVSVEATFRFWDALGLPLLTIGWICIFHYCVRYRVDRFISFRSQIHDVFKAYTLSSFWLLLVSIFFSIQSINSLNLVVFWIIVTILGILSRIVLRVLLNRARKSGYNFRYLLMVGANTKSREVMARIEANPELGFKLAGFIAENDEVVKEWNEEEWGPILGELWELQEILKRERVDEIMVCLPVEARFKDISDVVQCASDLGIVVRVIPSIENVNILKNLHIEEFEGENVLTLFRERMVFQLLLKRLVDLSVSSVALVLLSPLMLVVGLLIKLTSPGPVFFVQDRVGMNKRVFRLLKFRSMSADAEERKKELMESNERDGPAFKIKNDPRITKIGKFIRKTSIDELPQLINVLRGEMSLVGPRPPLPEEVEKYEWLFRKRLSVKPGITCFWQISGRNEVSFKQWMKMDQDYVENWSVLLDLKILFKTVPVVLLGKGSS